MERIEPHAGNAAAPSRKLFRSTVFCLSFLVLGSPVSRANTAVEAAPRDAGWMAAHEKLVKRAQKGAVPLLFVGDSITQRWKREDGGREVWKEYYEPLGAVEIGLSGDKTQNILWRLRHGGLGTLQPKITVILAGINNINKNTPPEIAAGVSEIVKELETRLPATRILVLGVFPKGRLGGTPEREKIKEVNALMAKFDDGKRVCFLDIGEAFLESDGSLKPDVMPDELHPGPAGYRIWAAAMSPKLKELAEMPPVF